MSERMRISFTLDQARAVVEMEDVGRDSASPIKHETSWSLLVSDARRVVAAREMAASIAARGSDPLAAGVIVEDMEDGS